MLKLVISSTTLTNISASIAGFAASVAVVKESHKGLIAIQAEKDIKMAKLFDVTVEQYKLEKEFYQKDKSSFLDKFFETEFLCFCRYESYPIGLQFLFANYIDSK